MNPFITSGYVSPLYFCDRESEANKLIGALKNGRNVAFISPRRLGKTGLILHSFYKIKQEDPQAGCFYIDIFSTQCKEDFIKAFAQAVIGKFDSWSEKLYTNVTSVLKHCRPIFSLDPVTGKPSFTIDILSGEENSTLADIVEYLERSGRQCYVAIDEFQQITEYPQKGIDAALRVQMQLAQNVHFIFAGSKKHLMMSLFSNPSQPMFQSVQKMGLDPLPEKTYYEFARCHMQSGGKLLPQEVFHKAYSFARGFTWYVQDLMNRLYELPKNEISMDDLNETMIEIQQEGETTYKDYCELMAKGQLRLLRAIAAEDCVAKPFENSFLTRHGLNAVSSVKQALTVLVNANVVAKSEEGFFIYDRYLSLWLRK